MILGVGSRMRAHPECALNIVIRVEVRGHSAPVPHLPGALLQVEDFLLLRAWRPVLRHTAGRQCPCLEMAAEFLPLFEASLGGKWESIVCLAL